jgi:hypothetical protein
VNPVFEHWLFQPSPQLGEVTEHTTLNQDDKHANWCLHILANDDEPWYEDQLKLEN